MSKFSENPDNAKLISTAKFLFGGWIRSGVWLVAATVLLGHFTQIEGLYYWTALSISLLWLVAGTIKFLAIVVRRWGRKAIKPENGQKSDIEVSGTVTRHEYRVMKRFCQDLPYILKNNGIRAESRDEEHEWIYPAIYSISFENSIYVITLELLKSLSLEDYDRAVRAIEDGLRVARCRLRQTDEEKRKGQLRLVLFETDPLNESFPLPDEDEF